MSPFIILDLPRDCSDADVRAAYHKMLRRYPPETCPDEFQQIQEAAGHLETERQRWACHLLYHNPEVQSPLETLQAFAGLPGRSRPPGLAAFKTLTRACAAAARKSTR